MFDHTILTREVQLESSTNKICMACELRSVEAAAWLVN